MESSTRKRSYPDAEMLDSPSKRSRIEIDSMSSVAEPLVLADAPIHQAIWNTLPTGTLFETVRIARAANVDLAAIPSQRLLTLRGPNSHGIKHICEVLGVPDVPVMDEKVAGALDWEAQCIVEGKGAMLECDLQPGQERLSGRVIFSASLSMTQLSASPTQRPLSKSADSSILTMRIPRMSQSCLFTRVFGSHRFLRISIQDRNRRAFLNQEAANRLFQHSLRPIKILGRIFRPLVEKESTVWYYLEGRDLVGATAEQYGRKVAGDYGLGRLIDDVPKLIDWWIPLEHNGEQLVCKLVTRLHLGISGTWAGPLMLEGIQLQEDITREGYTFTDGAGMISEVVAHELWQKSPVPYTTLPSAYQIRVATAKGVVQVAPRPSPEGRWMTITSSMLKARHIDRSFRPGPVGGLHILDAAHTVICVVKASACRIPARLNAQIIPILCQQGVPEHVIQNFQARTIEDGLEALLRPSVAFSDLKSDTRLKLAKTIQSQANLIYKILISDPIYDGYVRFRSRNGSTSSMDEFAVDDNLATTTDKTSDFTYANLVHGKNEQLYLAILSGFDVMTSQYFINSWKSLIEKAAKSVFANFHINVDGSALVTMIPDFTETLEEGFISFTPPAPIADCNGNNITFTSGSVLVGRNPALLCTDIQKVQLANVPALRERRGVIFFSTKGTRPLADFLAGGDYDGDEAIIIWDQSIVTPFNNAVFEDDEFVAQVARDSFSRDELKVATLNQRLKCMKKDEGARLLEEHLLGSLKVPPLLGYYYSFYLKAVHHYGIASQEARLMAHKFNIIMDSSRTSWKLDPQAKEDDKKLYDIYCDPLWKCEQDGFRRGSRIEDNHRIRFKTIIPNILDNLFLHGEATYKRLYREISQTRLEPRPNLSQRQKLLLPWEQAREWTQEIPGQKAAREAELQKVQSTVEAIFEDFKGKMTFKDPYSQQQTTLVQLVRRFESEPLRTEIPQLSSLDASTVQKVKASYAYYIDTKYAFEGRALGIPWKMASPTLFGLVTDHQIILPHGTFTKLTPHHSFCKDPES